VPNDWTGGSIYPKPGNLAYNAAPLWYTYSWGEDAGTSNTAYFWSHLATTSANRLSFSSDTASTSSITYTFFGDTLKWIYTKAPKAGIISVKVDGVEKGPIDQYNAAVQYKQSSTFNGLGAGAHTVVIKSTGTKNAASTGLFTYHDAFEAPGFSGDVHTNSENNMDGSTLYDWQRTTYAGASGTQFSSAKASSAAMAFTFNGTSITWKYIKAPKAGIANVYIDGVLQPTVDQYGAGVSTAQAVYSGLAAGWHTILIKSSGNKNAASTGLFTYHDAFVVGATTYEN
jgi:hypothetical protein